MHVLAGDQPRNALFKPGTILWREIFFKVAGTAHLCGTEQAEYVLEGGSLMLRVNLQGYFMWEPVVYPSGRGVVAFLKGKHLPENWTHLVVDQPKLTYDPITGRHAGCLILRADKPYPLTEYLQFRQQMCGRVRGNLNASFDARCAMALLIQPPDVRPELVRLISAFEDYQTRSLRYGHIRQRQEVKELTGS
jgi:hypothetical protein